LNNTDEFEALWPCGVNAVSAIDPAPRPNDLNGKRIGFLWDNLFSGGNEHEMLAGLPHQLKELNIDAVVSGIGC
jgi:hypothetical protein